MVKFYNSSLGHKVSEINILVLGGYPNVLTTQCRTGGRKPPNDLLSAVRSTVIPAHRDFTRPGRNIHLTVRKLWHIHCRLMGKLYRM